MNIPGFAAESALGPALGKYMGKSVHCWSIGGVAKSNASISPQQLSILRTLPVNDCFGSFSQCVAEHCADVDNPRQRALCFSACRQPAVCGPCRCSAGTCERECRKSFVSSSGGVADVFCTGPCSL